MPQRLPFSADHPLVREAEERAIEYLTGGDEDGITSLVDARSARTGFSTVVDDFAKISNLEPAMVLGRFCRPNTCPMIDVGCLKMPTMTQSIVEGLPAIIVSVTDWGCYTFVTPVPYLDKTQAKEILQNFYGALKVSFIYCNTEGFLGLFERVQGGGRIGEVDKEHEDQRLGLWWKYLSERKIVSGDRPASIHDIVAAIPKKFEGGEDETLIVSSLNSNIPYVDFTRSSVEQDLPQLAPAIQKHYGLTPVSFLGNLCTLACSRAISARERGEMSTKGIRVCYVLSNPEKIKQAIIDWEARRLSASEIASRIEVEEQRDEHVIEEIDITELVKRSGEDNPTVVELVQSIIVHGIQNNATDIHISTHPTRMWVRFRIDGFLSDYPNPLEAKLSRQVVSRIKIMANIDTQYSPIPQDGKFSISFQHREFDIRVNTAPTVYGDKAILRLLPKRFRLPTLDNLGFLPHERNIVSKIIAADHGLLVICGPTGAGKSTTLAAAIGMVDSTRYVVVTGEQPVEMRIPNIEQTNVTASVENPGGLTFARFLEAALRQDPDYIMIGETRDADTASQVVRAALTGHVVMTTLHTNSAPTAPGRLIDLGVQPFLLKEALSAVVAQRLLPRICTNCSSPSKPPSAGELKKLGLDVAWFLGEENFQESIGCAMCRGTGYSGRVGIFEGYTVDGGVRRAIGDGGGNATQIREAMRSQGGRTLLEQACYLYAKGVTDLVSALTMRSEDEDGY